MQTLNLTFQQTAYAKRPMLFNRLFLDTMTIFLICSTKFD